jgi:hypothetical protein
MPPVESQMHGVALTQKAGFRMRNPFRRLEQVDERLELVFPTDESRTGDGHRSAPILGS